MKKLLPATAALLTLAACDPAPYPGSSISAEDPQQFSESFYAARPTEYSWPAASETPVQVSSSLLTPNYYLVIDGSGSMHDSGCSGDQRKIDVAKTAVNQFISNMPDNANLGMLAFDYHGIGERAPLGTPHQTVKQHVQNIAVSGSTPLLSAITAAYQAISLQAQKQFGYGEYHLIVITDGEADQGEDPGRIVSRILRESPVVVHTIGFCIGAGHSLNVSGVTNYRAANNPQELLAGLQNVLAESSEYVMDTFESANQEANVPQ